MPVKPTTRAPAPKIPNPLDDGAYFHEETGNDSEQEDDAPARPQPIHEEPRAENGSTLDRERNMRRLVDCIREKSLGVLYKLPAEIRIAIYEKVLVSNSPIRVHSGWRFVFKRQSLGIPTSILRTSRHVYNEAIGVLYGSNKFRYILRDHVSRVTDVDQLAQMDDADAPFPSNGDVDQDYDTEDENDPEWREETSNRNASRRRNTRRRGTKAADLEDINIQKHASLFRHIIVEAEHNRTFERTKKLMANALRIFKYQVDDNRRQLYNIHTVTIKVTPKWEPPETEQDSGYYTFVDFFHKSSPIMDAVWRIQCQFLFVELMGCHWGGEARPGRQLKIDRRHLRLYIEVMRSNDDAWKGDKVMQKQRTHKARRVLSALAILDKHVAATCEKYLEQTGPGDDGFLVEELD